MLGIVQRAHELEGEIVGRKECEGDHGPRHNIEHHLRGLTRALVVAA